ncbi:MAG: helix-turn-helix domain-containing protein, partial [Candidatus Fonsibacter lacus]|nr:helix-turn-helix domain-containing protein [Candidatus Fonsibacter lacus]
MPICPDLPGLVGLSAAAACCYGPVSFARVQTKRAVHPRPVPALIALARMLGRMHNKLKLTPASISAARQNVRVSRIRQVKAATVDQLSPAARCLLRSLIDYLGESEVCWPSVATLASECGLSNRHVRRILRELELSGWILSSPRRRPDGGQTSSLISWRRGAPAGDGATVPAVSPPPDTGVRPIEDSGNTHKQHAECVLHENSSEQQDGPAQTRQAQTSPGRPDSLQDGPAAPAEHPDIATADGGPVPVAFGPAAAQILQRVRT